MNPSANPVRRASGPRKTRGAPAPDSSTSNQRQAGLDTGANTKSGASSGDTPIVSDDRSGACATSVPPASTDAGAMSGGA
jgi:hypothetical protein